MTTDGDVEVTHFQRLDLEKLREDAETDRVRIREEAALKRTQEPRLMLHEKRRQNWDEFLFWVLGFAAAISIIMGMTWGIWAMATSGSPKSPEQIVFEHKQDRWDRCTNDKNNIWYPTANGGEGMCQSREKEPPK